VGAANENRSEFRRVDLAEFQLRAVGIAQLAYFGASLAALAVGSAPDDYAAAPDVQDNVKALRGYFEREHGKVSLLNQLMGIWAAGHVANLLTGEQRQATIAAAFALQTT
jgi:squalene-hopene/tetraprenyl-beta-curcumene cyclase